MSFFRIVMVIHLCMYSIGDVFLIVRCAKIGSVESF